MVGKGGLPKLPVSIARPKLAVPKQPTIELDADATAVSAVATTAKKAPSISAAKLEPILVDEQKLPDLRLEVKDELVADEADETDETDETEGSHSVPSTEVEGEAVSVREQAISALRGAGFFDRPIIGRSPEELSDEDLNEQLAELARRSLVSEVTGKDVRDVKDADFGNLLDTTQHQVIEDVLGIPLDALTPVGKALVEAEIRDTTGTSSQGFRDLVDDLAAGTNNAGFIRPTDAWNTGAAGGAMIVGGGTSGGGTSGGSDGGSDGDSSGGDGSSSGTGTDGAADFDLGFAPSDRFAPIGGDSATGGTGGSNGDTGPGGTDSGGTDSGGSSTGGSTDSDSTTSGGGGSGSGTEGNGDEQRHVLVVETSEGSTSYTYYEREDGSMYVVGSDGTTREATSDEVEVWGSGGSDDDDDDDSSSGDAGDSEPSTEFTPNPDNVDFGDPFGLLPERQIVFEDDGATDPTDDGGAGGEVDSGYVRRVPDVSQPVDQDTRYVDLRNLTFSPPDDGVTDPVDSMATFSAIDDAAGEAFAAFEDRSFTSRSFESASDDGADSAATDDDGQDSGLPDFG